MRSNTSSLADRALAPATRLMSRLRFTQKAVVIGAAFVLTCAVLTGFIATSTYRGMSAAKLAGSASAPMHSMNDAMLAMQQHRGIALRQIYKSPAPATAAATTAAAVDKGLAAVDAWQNEHFRDRRLDKQIAAVKAAWAKAQADETDPAKAVAAHNDVLRQARLLVKQVDVASGMSLVSDPAMFYASRSVADWLPLLSDASSQYGTSAIHVLGEQSIWADDRADFASAGGMEQFLIDRIKLDLAELEKNDATAAATVTGPLNDAIKAIRAHKAFVQTNVLDAETQDFPIASMAAQNEAMRASVRKASDALSRSLDEAAADEVATLRDKALVVIAIVLLSLGIAAYLFLGFSRSTRNSLAKIKNAAELLAAGQFPDKVGVDSSDELRVIGDGIENVVVALRGFAKAQQDMFNEHQAGNIDHRIDAEQFPGSYGVMADDLNTLVASHIDSQMKVMDLVAQYARGDLSQDIERYPGQKARITQAMDAVKAGMLKVTDEIRTLVDAAKAGDFSQRGDAGAYEFIYADMVANLNTLMHSADHGLREVGSLLAAVSDGDLTQNADEATCRASSASSRAMPTAPCTSCPASSARSAWAAS